MQRRLARREVIGSASRSRWRLHCLARRAARRRALTSRGPPIWRSRKPRAGQYSAAVAHAGARGHAPALRTEPARRGEGPEAAGHPGARPTPSSSDAGSTPGPTDSRASASRFPGLQFTITDALVRFETARRPHGADHRAPLAALGRDRGLAIVVGGGGHLRRRGHPAHPVRRRSPAVRARPAADRRGIAGCW